METSGAKEAVVWAYRMLLGREPESEDVVRAHAQAVQSCGWEAIRNSFMQTPEFASAVRRSLPHPRPGITALEEYRDSTPYPREQGFYRDLFGIKTRVSFLPPIYARFSGWLPGDYEFDLLPMHDDVELFGMIHAGGSVRDQFVVMELGAGWGPWVSMAAAMARQRGWDYRLIAVEGLESHFEFLRTHIQDNDIDLNRCRLLHGVVGTSDGVVRFPKVPIEDYSASLDLVKDHAGEFEEVPSFTVASLLKDEPIVDIAHFDIQGHEVDAIHASIEVMNDRMRRVVVGTHSRVIESELFDLFHAAGWRLEMEIGCMLREVEGVPTMVQDGAQLWMNPRLLKAQ